MLAWRLLGARGAGSFTPPEEDMTFHGAKAYHDEYTTWADQEARALDLNSTAYDTDNYHFTSAANLTGTVTKTATSAAIVGSGTSFLSELSVNQVISIPGTETEIGVVKSITDNTHLTLWQTMANSASGQTARRRNEYMAIPAGLAGHYRITGGTFIGNAPYQDAPMFLARSGIPGTIIGGSVVPYTAQPSDVGGTGQVHAEDTFAAGEYLWIDLYIDHGSTKTFYVGGAADFDPTWSHALASWLAVKFEGNE